MRLLALSRIGIPNRPIGLFLPLCRRAQPERPAEDYSTMTVSLMLA
jgi:hypothetical protein